MALARDAVMAERLVRQGLANPVARAAQYEALLRRLQPVSTGPYARPGSPPQLPGRTRFDGLRTAAHQRALRTQVKGRFQGGSVGYVHHEDLALYASAFARPLARPSENQRRVLDDKIVIVCRMIGRNQNAVLIGKIFRCQRFTF